MKCSIEASRVSLRIIQIQKFFFEQNAFTFKRIPIYCFQSLGIQRFSPAHSTLLDKIYFLLIVVSR